MGILDNLGDAAETAKDAAKEHGADAVEKVADVVDEKTGGKFSEQIDQAKEVAKDKLEGE